MSQLLEKLHHDHINLSRLLDLLSAQLDALFAGHESDFDLKIELLDYIEHYAEQHHHPTEDIINQSAFAKPSMQEHEALYQRVSREHEALLGMARRFRETLEGIMQGEVLRRDEVETRGREFIALQRQHIDLEEQEIFPLVSQALSDKEWEKLEQKIPHMDDPVFHRQDYNRFRSLIDYLELHESE
ncbi:MAG: hemerythrin domain-containing protein [Candidatus Thiodiazotropha sp. (ex Monitilora ramsayi)]|nr:hemerythrin domain-containing protein [Candidatus Thiodiazotropha sp. (ex Monitilora ramsayi)]